MASCRILRSQTSAISSPFASRSSQHVYQHSGRGLELSKTFASSNRTYHSYEHDDPAPFSLTEEAILSSAFSHVPTHGFTSTALSLGCRDEGYLDATINLFPDGPLALVRYHLVTQRLALKRNAQFPDSPSFGLGAKIRFLALHRLRLNEPIIYRWQQALALISASPRKGIPLALSEIHLLSDELWFLAGDTSVDSSWYTKRASLSTVYAATEIFQTTDTSPGFVETERFLDRRLEEVKALGGTVGNVKQWAGFTARGFVNLGRSWGVRM